MIEIGQTWIPQERFRTNTNLISIVISSNYAIFWVSRGSFFIGDTLSRTGMERTMTDRGWELRE